jgi:hypothetical protein
MPIPVLNKKNLDASRGSHKNIHALVGAKIMRMVSPGAWKSEWTLFS